MILRRRQTGDVSLSFSIQLSAAAKGEICRTRAERTIPFSLLPSSSSLCGEQLLVYPPTHTSSRVTITRCTCLRNKMFFGGLAGSSAAKPSTRYCEPNKSRSPLVSMQNSHMPLYKLMCVVREPVVPYRDRAGNSILSYPILS